MPRRPPISTETSRAYATHIEFCRVFAENMDKLHLLSFLLTADLAKAEECFVSGLEDCVEGTYVFRDWAQSWARRTIIQNAIHMLAPRKNHSTVADAPSDTVTCSFGRTQDTDYAIARILRLEDFERFVFVMSVLEKYSDQDCSVLLGCSRQDVGETRMRALLHLAKPDTLRSVAPSECGSSDPEEAQTPEVQLEPQF
jgi:DNA-directed RNA polymerase specialized sigma24 family protein